MVHNDPQNALLDQAEGKLAFCDSPWAKLDYLRLRETLEAIVSCMEGTTQRGGVKSNLSPMKSHPRPRLD